MGVAVRAIARLREALSGSRPGSAVLLRVACGLLLCGLAVACTERARVDADWHRRALVETLLVRWLEAAPTPTGFLTAAVDRKWKARPNEPGYLTNQARLVYAMIAGYEVTREPRYLDAAQRGAEFMLTHFRDPVNGGFFQIVAPDGKVISPHKLTYDNATALFALAHMARVTGEARHRTAALKAWSDIDGGLRNPKGGYFYQLPADFSKAGMEKNAANSQNPLMHLFEALLALHEATGEPAALAGAKDLGDFVIYRLLQGEGDGGAFIPEWYDGDWKPVTDRGKGGYTDLGHQFEWSHLLLTAAERGLSGVYAQTAERLLRFAIHKGYDEFEGGVFTKLYPDGKMDRDKYFWQQAEGLRAFVAHAKARNEPDLWRRYEQTLGLVREEFIDATGGGWYFRARSKCGDPGCLDRQVEPYHMIGMHLAAIRAATPAKR